MLSIFNIKTHLNWKSRLLSLHCKQSLICLKKTEEYAYCEEEDYENSCNEDICEEYESEKSVKNRTDSQSFDKPLERSVFGSDFDLNSMIESLECDFDENNSKIRFRYLSQK